MSWTPRLEQILQDSVANLAELEAGYYRATNNRARGEFCDLIARRKRIISDLESQKAAAASHLEAAE